MGLFPAELLFFCALAFSRFFDHKQSSHPLPFPFMDSYGFALAELLVYLALFCGLCVLLIFLAKERERDMVYLCEFLAVFLVPFFCHRSYFGTVDMAVWTLVLAVSLVVAARCTGKGEKSAVRKKQFLLLLMILLPSVFLAVFLGGPFDDVQTLLSAKQFLLLLIFFSPYLYIGGKFLLELCREVKKRRPEMFGLYFLYACAGWMPAGIWTIVGDYSRAVFYGFVCYLLPAACFVAIGDDFFAARLERIKETVKKVLPMPEVFVIYPLIFITFWMMGWESIPAEEILKLQ